MRVCLTMTAVLETHILYLPSSLSLHLFLCMCVCKNTEPVSTHRNELIGFYGYTRILAFSTSAVTKAASAWFRAFRTQSTYTSGLLFIRWRQSSFVFVLLTTLSQDLAILVTLGDFTARSLWNAASSLFQETQNAQKELCKEETERVQQIFGAPASPLPLPGQAAWLTTAEQHFVIFLQTNITHQKVHSWALCEWQSHTHRKWETDSSVPSQFSYI